MIEKLIGLTLILITCISCGKEVENSPPNQGGTPPRTQEDDIADPSILRFIAKQTVFCEDEEYCPENIAKIIIIDRQTTKYCTGTLIAPDIMMTSSSCLVPSLRIPNHSCSANVFTIFPKKDYKSTVSIGCQKILASDNNEDIDPALWSSDVAFYKLKETVPRSPIKISREGFKEDFPYVTWKINWNNDYDSTIVMENCYPIYDSYANPFAVKRSSPLIPVSECELAVGNTGSPLINGKNEVVGILSSIMDKKVGTYVANSDVLSEPITKHINHVVNMSCVKMPNPVSTYNFDKECSKTITEKKLLRLRSYIMHSPAIHHDNMVEIEKELEIPNKIFKWDFKFEKNHKNNSFEVHMGRPKCFYDIKSWINEKKFTRWGRIKDFVKINVEYKDYRISTKLNRVLKAESIVSLMQNDNGSPALKNYTIEFNPKYAFNFNSTFVNIISTLHGKPSWLHNGEITDECGN